MTMPFLTLIKPVAIISLSLLGVIVLGVLGYLIFQKLNASGTEVNTTLTRDSYRIKELTKINDKFKFDNLEKEYHFEYKVASKEEMDDFDYSSVFCKLVAEKTFLFTDSMKKAESNAKLMEKYQEAVDGIYFNKKILIGEATSKQVNLGTYKRYEKAHFQEILYKPVTEVAFHIDVTCDDPKVKPSSSVYTTDDVMDALKKIEREKKQQRQPQPRP